MPWGPATFLPDDGREEVRVGFHFTRHGWMLALLRELERRQVPLGAECPDLLRAAHAAMDEVCARFPPEIPVDASPIPLARRIPFGAKYPFLARARAEGRDDAVIHEYVVRHAPFREEHDVVLANCIYRVCPPLLNAITMMKVRRGLRDNRR